MARQVLTFGSFSCLFEKSVVGEALAAPDGDAVETRTLRSWRRDATVAFFGGEGAAAPDGLMI